MPCAPRPDAVIADGRPNGLNSRRSHAASPVATAINRQRVNNPPDAARTRHPRPASRESCISRKAGLVKLRTPAPLSPPPPNQGGATDPWVAAVAASQRRVFDGCRSPPTAQFRKSQSSVARLDPPRAGTTTKIVGHGREIHGVRPETGAGASQCLRPRHTCVLGCFCRRWL
jgi:hypothetical protein